MYGITIFVFLSSVHFMPFIDDCFQEISIHSDVSQPLSLTR